MIQLVGEVGFSFDIFPESHIFLQTSPARRTANPESVSETAGEDKMSRLY